MSATAKPKVGRVAPNTPWPTVPLHRIARHHSGNSKLIKGKLHSEPAENLFPAFSATGQDVWRDDYDREGDAIIISAVGARCGKCFIARGRWSAIANTHVVWPDPEQVDLKFLWYLLNDERFWIRSGSAQPFVAVRKTFEKEISLPPLPEQRRIVAEIEKQFTRLDAGVAALRRVQANLKRYRAAVLKAACEGRLVPTGGSLPPPLKSFGPSSRLPNGWRWTTPAEICEQVVDCHNKTAPYTDSGIPLVRTTNIRGGKIDMSETRFVTQSTYEFWSRRCIPKPGDVLFTREAPMGEAGIIPENVTLCMGQRMMLLRSSPKILNRYLLAALIGPGLTTYITRTAVGSGVKHLRVRDVESLPIPLPPLAEQTQIVAEVEQRLSVVEELETVVNANLQRATRLRQSILQRSFPLPHNECNDSRRTNRRR